MNFKKKINSKNKVFNIIGLILLPIIVLILLKSSFNFVGDSENYYEKSSSTSQLQTKKDLLEEKESFEYKKKEDLVSSNEDLDVQNSNEKDVLNKNTKKNNNIAKSEVNKKDKLSLNLNTKKTDSLKASEDPIKTVNFLHQGLRKISSNNNSDLKNVLKVINRTYDVEKMLKMIIGADWKNQENEKKKELIIVFKEYISKNYLKRFSKINDVSFSNEKKEKISSEFFLVRSNLVIKKEKISIDYLLSLKDNTWKIFDVLLDGSVSEIATKKSEFRIYIKEKKIDELIEALKKFNSQIQS
tara:strand:+ start:186 stop:1082 length:897 start_codon:yes stop_codon:yes gene_type:complete